MARAAAPTLSSILPPYANTEHVRAWVLAVDDDILRGWNECPSFLYMLHILRGLGVRSTEWSDLFSPEAVAKSAAMTTATSKFSAYFANPTPGSRDALAASLTQDEATAGQRAADEVMEALRERFDIVALLSRAGGYAR
ncbi:MAG: hypothetical protein R3B40_18175 [Polyangiales bacterium]